MMKLIGKNSQRNGAARRDWSGDFAEAFWGGVPMLPCLRGIGKGAEVVPELDVGDRAISCGDVDGDQDHGRGVYRQDRFQHFGVLLTMYLLIMPARR